MNVNPRCCKSNGLQGIFDVLGSALIGGGSGSFSGGGGSSGSAVAPSSATTVSPTISTQISPSISPVFQQQFQPSGSAMTAGTSAAPAFSAPGFAPDGSYLPATPIQAPVLPQPLPVPAQAGMFGGSKTLPLLIIGGGLIGYFLLSKR